MTNFDVEMIIIDNAGYQFIDSCNENKEFIKDKIELKFFDFISDKDGLDYELEIKKARRQYNKQDQKKVFKQIFSSDFIRKGNEHLQANIDHKRLWFASRTTANEAAFNKYSGRKVNLNEVNEKTKLEFMETQDNLIHQTKKQCALIEVKSSAKGTQTFDLPLHLKKSESINRARRDNYTTLMLGNWAIKCYYDMMNAPKEEAGTFVPRML